MAWMGMGWYALAACPVTSHRPDLLQSQLSCQPSSQVYMQSVLYASDSLLGKSTGTRALLVKSGVFICETHGFSTFLMSPTLQSNRLLRGTAVLALCGLPHRHRS